MPAITWLDVKGYLRHPVQAHDATGGTREVQARHWRIPAAVKPYVIKIKLLEHGVVVETWTADYKAKAMTASHRSYSECLAQAEQWLEGRSLDHVRPAFVKRSK